jgi:Protein of unknown function (DUF3761)
LQEYEINKISEKFRTLLAENDLEELNAQNNTIKFESDLASIQPRLHQLSQVTFKAYLSKSLAGHKFLSVIFGISLIIIQLISGISATTATIIAAIPTITMTPTVTVTPTVTTTPTPTITFTATLIPSVTVTYTVTNSPTLSPRLAINSIIQLPTDDPLQQVTAICNDGTYSYSLHRRGTCSHHGGVREWVHRPPS